MASLKFLTGYVADWGSSLIKFTLEQGSKLLHSFAPPLEQLGLEVLADIDYVDSGHEHHLLDIYRLRDRNLKSPCMLYIHGGGFRTLSKDSHWMMNRKFASSGLIVFSINYRLAPAATYPAAIEDAAHALLWLIKNGKDYGANTDEIFLAGESAGANLVLALVVAMSKKKLGFHWADELYSKKIKIKGALVACGILQVSEPERFSTMGLSDFFYARIKTICQSYLPFAEVHKETSRLANPLLMVEQKVFNRKLPAIFTFSGSDDPIVDDTLRLERALRKHKQDFKATYYAGMGHAFHAITWLDESKKCWADQLQFIKDRID